MIRRFEQLDNKFGASRLQLRHAYLSEMGGSLTGSPGAAWQGYETGLCRHPKQIVTGAAVAKGSFISPECCGLPRSRDGLEP
jgi:hypothetical protein